MNTLSRAITAQIFDDSDTYSTIRTHWRTLMQSSRRQELSASHHILYLALMGKDWRKGFTPVTNQRKLANGAFYDWKLFRALTLFHSTLHQDWLLTPFDGIVTVESLQAIRRFIPKVSAYNYTPTDFAPGQFPFEAYEIPEAMASTSVPDKEYSHV